MTYLIIVQIITLIILVVLARNFLFLRHARRTCHRLIDHINVGYYRYRARDGVILAANKAFVDILELGSPVEDIVGRSLSELLIYVDGEGSIRSKLKQRGELKNYEYRFRTLEGKEKVVIHNSYIVKSPGGEETIEALIEDVTEERRSYQKMKESQQRYEKLFKNSGDMVIICKFDDFIIEEINPVTEVITGFSQEELVGKPFGDFFHPTHRKGLKESREDLLFRGNSRAEAIIVCKNGSYKEVILTLSLVEIKEHRVVLILVKDVSAMARERVEQQKRKKELEEFWKASTEREERIKDLRGELERTKQQLKMKKQKNGSAE
ncbi:MAG: PAS domain S-box protein [Candidatus Omnitrophica bacterium]|nr:PAS domain S-box protein [Candidatus Omnitrophota bacterium]